MLTFEHHNMAFQDDAGRAEFFARGRHEGVSPGTAMRHVLGTNLGIWGSEDSLMRDAAKIVGLEIDTWARANGQPCLGIPVEGIMSEPTFRSAFNAWRAPNRNEMDSLVRSGGREIPSASTPDVSRYASDAFLEQLWHSLAPRADKYASAVRSYEEHLTRIGMR